MDQESTWGFARKLRKEPTLAERRLWGYLRKRSLGGFRFNRQVPIGPYIVDFLCRERRLVIEVDGATHGEPHEIAHDLRRTHFLRSSGYAVYRADNGDIYQTITAVLDGILWALEQRPAVFAKPEPEPPPSLRATSPSRAEGG